MPPNGHAPALSDPMVERNRKARCAAPIEITPTATEIEIGRATAAAVIAMAMRASMTMHASAS